MDTLGRIMALDVGEVRTGVAVSDPMRIIASPHTVVPMQPAEKAWAQFEALLEELEPVSIVVGIPLDQRGEQGPQARKVLDFVEQLRARTDIDIVLQDERFSTVAAERTLRQAGARGKKRKQVVDKVAATHILRTYMDRKANECERSED